MEGDAEAWLPFALRDATTDLVILEDDKSLPSETKSFVNKACPPETQMLSHCNAWLDKSHIVHAPQAGVHCPGPRECWRS